MPHTSLSNLCCCRRHPSRCMKHSVIFEGEEYGKQSPRNFSVKTKRTSHNTQQCTPSSGGFSLSTDDISFEIELSQPEFQVPQSFRRPCARGRTSHPGLRRGVSSVWAVQHETLPRVSAAGYPCTQLFTCDPVHRMLCCADLVYDPCHALHVVYEAFATATEVSFGETAPIGEAGEAYKLHPSMSK